MSNDNQNIIYSGWAYTENEKEKAQTNRDTYNKIKDKVNKIDCICRGRTYNTYYVYPKTGESLTYMEAMLIADGGNLCFGGYFYGNKDDVITGNEQQTNYLSVKVYTD